MDKQLVWKDEFNIGIDAIDKEHQRLISIINRLFVLRHEEQKAEKRVRKGFGTFMNMPSGTSPMKRTIWS